MKEIEGKFIFTLEFELDLLKYTVTDKAGRLALKLYKPEYFNSIHYAVIADCLKKYFKRHHKIPGATILKEELIALFKTRDYANALTTEDKTTILSTAVSMYKPIRDGDEILDRAAKWAAYVELKGEIEGVDLLAFDKYNEFSSKIMKAINLGVVERESKGTFLIRDIIDRQFNRLDTNPIVPTPFKQINAITNAGGYVRGSVLVILDRPKKAKTVALANVAVGYIKMRKKVFIADMENGEDEYMLRIEEGVSGHDKREILSGDYDNAVQRTLRKYGRLGVDIFVKRYPAGATTNDFQVDMDRLHREEGIEFDILVVDYAAIMNSLSGKEDDFGRISDVYLDLANLALKNNLEHVWTANHVVREAKRRSKTRYTENDIAKCIDIVRHAQAIFGLNRNDYELDNGIMRMELVVQRDGQPYGRALFHFEPQIQRLKEFKHHEIKEYLEEHGGDEDDDTDGDTKKKYAGDV